MNKKERERIFLDHGGKLLEERIAFCNGRSNPTRNFSANQLQKAIDDFQKDHPSQNFRDFEWNKGVLDGRFLFIRNYDIRQYERGGEEVYHDIVISSQMSSHNNVLKLLGCCLELPGPALVYEYAENGSLDEQIRYGSLTWGTRLKIAEEIANAVTYLHSKFPRSIIHRDIKPSKIFLNQHYAAKLFDFSLAISIPEGESHVEDDLVGTFGFLDPEYFMTSFVTEKTDVHSFGVLLLVLLTGKSAMVEPTMSLIKYVKDSVEKDQINAIVDPTIWRNGEAIEPQRQSQLEAFLELALRCTNVPGKDGPLMIEVPKELQRIERAITFL